ncbi:YhgE/Pip family protein [Nakamurella sp. GG22]
MIKTVKLASFEVRRFKGPLPIVGLLFLLLVPTLYGALYLWSNWDPYGKTDQVPVAVVNLDEPVEVDGQQVAAGNRLVTELQKDEIFDWQFVSEDEASDGLAAGTYEMVVTIPPEFSADLASGAGQNPTRAIVVLQRDDANGIGIALLTASAQSQLEAAIDRSAIGAYFDSVFANLDTIRTDIGTAATAAGQLAAGATTALAEATDLSTGITAAKEGSAQVVAGLADDKAQSAQLVTGASDAKAGSASLLTALTALDTGAAELGPQAQEVADGNQQLASTVAPVLNAVSSALPALGQAGANIVAATDDVASFSSVLSQQSSDANSALAQLKASNPGADYGPIETALTGIQESASGLAQASAQASQVALDVNDAAQSVSSAGGGDLSGAGAELTGLATQSAQVATGVQSLSSGITTASSGAATLDSGVSQLSTGATALDSAIGQLQLVAQKLDDGLGTQEKGAATLVDQLTQQDTGAKALSTQLADAAKRVPTLDPAQRADAAQVLSSPADVQEVVDNPATYYGRGLAPFLFGLAIWGFGITAFALLRPVSARALAGRARSSRIAVAGWLPVLGIGAVGSLLLFGIVWLGLGLDPVNAWGALGVVVLAAACFTAIAHLLRTWLGTVGSAILLVLLFVQLTSAGGLYPVEVLPAPFRAVHNFIPLTYVVDALRITFTGGPTDRLWRDVAVLGVLTLIAVGLVVYVVHRKRRFTQRDLHPALG